ncbi:MAG TPA: RagB/SusD family nutrient uptake outer membrane protein, partial [Draconibacterium sp.]|nr:RagB/SusD family nutrient uptake outer membrane protein [Draconibacterium sp.]
MKNIKFLKLIIITLFITSCQDELLDKEPLDIISDGQVWNDPKLIDAYVIDLYSRAPLNGMFQNFTWDTWPPISPAEETYMSDEATSGWNWVGEVTDWNKGLLDAGGAVPVLANWDYNYVRACNEFLELIPTGNVTEEVKQQRSAEVRFLRAFQYFTMVKKYGGIPLITVPQKIDAGEANFVPRNKEQEVYDFILSECEAIAVELPENYDSKDLGRVTKYAALALKSRAALYAASIAKYSQLQLDGVVGISSGDAQKYWQASYDASKTIINSGKFELYNKYPDKVKNYQMLFMDINNSESILARHFIKLKNGHNFDGFFAPVRFCGFWGSGINVTMELVNAYEMVDGTSGEIDWANVKGYPSQILKNKDPRFHASIFYNGSPWQGDSLQIWYGIKTAEGNVVREDNPITYNGMFQKGLDATGENRTGFLIRKLLDESMNLPNEAEASHPWIEFRLGEILLNYSEAAFELGKNGDALDAINQIRSRAGIAALSAVTLDKIRNERRVEMAFENQRYYDARRWRIAENDFSKDFHRVYPIYDWNAKSFYFEV